ncbi:MAG: class I SAM-dependent methyltransferase [Deltaproteobacteria bacterium]|nr:class I SAM-dependent methyltransferase [Deltaproteobacteria bacterium]
MADQSSRAGERYASAQILEYAARTHHPEDRALARAFEAPARHGMPEIQLGPAEGRLLGLLLRLSQARKVVEIGTLAGYSACWIARALPPGGHLWTIESNPKHAGVAAEVIGEAGFGDRVTIIRDDAVAVLSKLNDSGPFCAVFLDADKGRYDLYGRWALENLRLGGLLIADNAYLFGRLLGDSDEAKAMRRFHEEMALHFDSVCVPTPDGLAVGVKMNPAA